MENFINYPLSELIHTFKEMGMYFPMRYSPYKIPFPLYVSILDRYFNSKPKLKELLLQNISSDDSMMLFHDMHKLPYKWRYPFCLVFSYIYGESIINMFIWDKTEQGRSFWNLENEALIISINLLISKYKLK